MWNRPRRAVDDYAKAGAPNYLALPTRGEVTHDGKKHLILDVEAVKSLFEEHGKPARKHATTLVFEAKGGEHTAQVHGTDRETKWAYGAQPGDAIFVQGNLEQSISFMHDGTIPEGEASIDVYVPDNAKLSNDGRLKFADLEAEGYELQGINPEDPAIRVKSPSALMLVGANQYHVCIPPKNEGGQYKFYPPGSSFKLLDGNVSAINPQAFDNTWEIVEAPDVQSRLLAENGFTPT